MSDSGALPGRSNPAYTRAVGECKVIGTHEEALYLEELRAMYRENRDPAIRAEVVEEHGITADEWDRQASDG